MATRKAPVSKRAAQTHKLFMRRSYTVYRHMQSRCGKLTFSVEALRDLIRAAIDNGQCPYLAHETVTAKNFSVDHATPVSRGGDGVSLRNLVVCSRTANLAKGNLTAAEFRSLCSVIRGELPEDRTPWPREAYMDLFGRLKAGAVIRRLSFVGGGPKGT